MHIHFNKSLRTTIRADLLCNTLFCNCDTPFCWRDLWDYRSGLQFKKFRLFGKTSATQILFQQMAPCGQTLEGSIQSGSYGTKLSKDLIYGTQPIPTQYIHFSIKHQAPDVDLETKDRLSSLAPKLQKYITLDLGVGIQGWRSTWSSCSKISPSKRTFGNPKKQEFNL